MEYTPIGIIVNTNEIDIDSKNDIDVSICTKIVNNSCQKTRKKRRKFG